MGTKAVLAGLIEREVSQLYGTLKGQVLSLATKNPVAKVFVEAQLRANETMWLTELGKQCDLIVEAACPNDTMDIAEAIANANSLVDAQVGNFLESKLGIPVGTLNVTLKSLLGG